MTAPIEQVDAGHDPDAEVDELEALMSETPSAGNHGRRAASRRAKTSMAHDGESWGDAYSSLDPEDHAAVQFVAGGGAAIVSEEWGHFHGLVTDRPPGRPLTLTAEELAGADRAALRAAALEALGFTEDDMALLDSTGRGGAETRALRERFDDACLRVRESTGRTNDLARALGWHVRRSQGKYQCDRMKKCLRRARARREAAAASDAA